MVLQQKDTDVPYEELPGKIVSEAYKTVDCRLDDALVITLADDHHIGRVQQSELSAMLTIAIIKLIPRTGKNPGYLKGCGHP